MALKITIGPQTKNARTVSLEGFLNSDTAPSFGERIRPLLGVAGSTLVLDMEGLEYLSSAGLREIFKAQKAQKAVQGKLAFMRLRPQIRKVFDIVNALPSMSIFASLQEMDDYLDTMQKQVTGMDAEDN